MLYSFALNKAHTCVGAIQRHWSWAHEKGKNQELQQTALPKRMSMGLSASGMRARSPLGNPDPWCHGSEWNETKLCRRCCYVHIVQP